MKPIVILILSLILCLGSVAQSTAGTDTSFVSRDTTSYAAIYIYVNWFDAINYTFNLYFNDTPIVKMPNQTWVVYTIHSEGALTVSDHKHQPFALISVKHGQKYYFRLRKTGAGRYYEIRQMLTDKEIAEYIKSGWKGDLGKATYILSEDPNKPVIHK
ncbi:MAG: hypothetical protein NTY96_00265 [Bacteroidetes bacterium]|nr:hypothetical protein [Bacteroidota bacterium]